MYTWDIQSRRALPDLRQELEKNSEAMIDYSVRLKANGAAESSVNKFSRRLKRGRSWGNNGLAAMIHTMAKRFEGKLAGLIEYGEVLEEMIRREAGSSSRVNSQR
ncbi:MAG TPA: hypothetical protein GXX40_09870 [Firmicutes bacterium]|nr:hypothetical protein [Bacillota bacterium]